MAIETKRAHVYSDTGRYLYDFKMLTYKNGWAQIDTKQDASYFGIWTNPDTREIFSYCEGDTSHTRCDTDEEYKQAIAEVVQWNKDAGYWLGIDPGFGEAMKERFTALGMSELLH